MITGCGSALEVKPDSFESGYVPVYLNVYDLTPANGYFYWAGLGIYHSGVEVHGVEYAFGAHDYPTSGVFEAEPRRCLGFKFRKSIFIGTTSLDPIQIREFMECHSASFNWAEVFITFTIAVKRCSTAMGIEEIKKCFTEGKVRVICGIAL
ncbi:Detected protein of confused Function [Hibiscus syriacus]|uniref:Detected protein of confused Function n=1 Tax=Hibiscus syriacus TaxID=106335 RepID=A0A6A2WDW6_HIBSY|nr:Detected protein of confused Function [Hibiscus syriacus]